MLRVTHTGNVPGPVLINDIDDGLSNRTARRLLAPPSKYERDGHADLPKQKCYVPRGGSIDLHETDKVLLSYSRGTMAGFVRAGVLTAEWLPSISSLSHSLVDTRGTATPLVIEGSGFLPGATVTLGGSTATSVNVVNSARLSCLPPAHAAGVVDVVVENPNGLTDEKSVEYWGPEGETLTGLWRDFSAVPWVGQPSAGISNGRTWPTASGGALTAGSLNQHGVAVFPAGNSRLRTNLALSQYFSTNAWTLQIVARSDVSDQFLFSDASGWIGFYMGLSQLGASGTVLSVDYWDNPNEPIRLEVPFTIGPWFILQVVYNGTLLKMRVDGGPWASIQAGPIFNMASVMSLGAIPGFRGSVAEMWTSNTVLSDAKLEKARHYVFSAYNTPLV